MFEIHPSARDNFDSKVEQLRAFVQKVDTPKNYASPIPDIHIAARIAESEIIGDIGRTEADSMGKTTARFVTVANETYGVVGDGYKQLAKVAEGIQILGAFRERLSPKYVEKELFTWLVRNFINAEKTISFISSLIEEAKKVVKPLTVFIPIANTAVESPFLFCGATIRSFSKAMLDKMAAENVATMKPEFRDNAEKLFENIRIRYQGYAVVELKMECEPEYANNISVDKSNRICDLLGIYSAAALVPGAKCSSRPKGSENVTQFTMISISNSGLWVMNRRTLDNCRDWYITKNDLNLYSGVGLRAISDIAINESRSEFESLVLTMALLYSKAAFTGDPLEKLVYMLSALESTLLKNENEPIQQNLAERMAMFISDKLPERKAIIKNVKVVYGLRSRYLHHGHPSSEIEALSEFFRYVWVFYVKLVLSSKEFKNKVQFLDSIDDQKLS